MNFITPLEERCAALICVAIIGKVDVCAGVLTDVSAGGGGVRANPILSVSQCETRAWIIGAVAEPKRVAAARHTGAESGILTNAL